VGTTGRVRQKKIATEAGRESEKKDKQKCDDRFSIERLTGNEVKVSNWRWIAVSKWRHKPHPFSSRFPVLIGRSWKEKKRVIQSRQPKLLKNCNGFMYDLSIIEYGVFSQWNTMVRIFIFMLILQIWWVKRLIPSSVFFSFTFVVFWWGWKPISFQMYTVPPNLKDKKPQWYVNEFQSKSWVVV